MESSVVDEDIHFTHFTPKALKHERQNRYNSNSVLEHENNNVRNSPVMSKSSYKYR